MSSGCGDVLSLADLQTAKKHQIFEAEVITGKFGGVATGADIDYATNQVTGQVQKTLPAVLRDAGFSPVSWDFSTGGTLTVNDRDKVVYDPVSNTWYSYAGSLPVTVPAGFNPVGDVNWKPQTDPYLRDELASLGGASLLGGGLYNDIRNYAGDATRINCLGANMSYDGGGGVFYVDTDDTTSTDNGGTILVDVTGRRWKRSYSGSVNLAWWGMSYMQDVTAALATAVRLGPVSVDKFYTLGQLQIVPGMSLTGTGPGSSGFVLSPPTAAVSGGETANFYIPPDSENISDVYIGNMAIDGGRNANPTIQYHHCFGVWAAADKVHSNFKFENVSFKNAGEDFIRFTALSTTAKIENIDVVGCAFKTDDDKIGLPGYSAASSGSAVRTITAYSPYAAYGDRTIRGVSVVDCRAEKIRTLADLKRGTYSSSVSKCFTVDMFDCHHSCDGAFNLVFSDLTCFTHSDFTGGTATNFIEVQGEGVIVNNVTGDANDYTKIGIQVTDYGLPAESNVGHSSVNVMISNVRIRNAAGDGIKVMNGINCSVTDCCIMGCQGHSLLITSGNSRLASVGGDYLKGYNNTYDNISGSGWSYPVKSQGNQVVRGRVINAQGQDDIYMPGQVLRIASDDYGAWYSKHQPRNIIPNPLLEITGASTSNLKWFNNSIAYDQVVAAASAPTDCPVAVTVSDTSSTSLREIQYYKIPAKQNDIFYARISVKYNTAASFGLVIKEYDSSGSQIGSSVFYTCPMASLTTWTDLVAKHVVSGSGTASISVGILPAGGTNVASNTGATYIANFRFGRSPFGLA